MASLGEMFGAGAGGTFMGLPRCDDLAGLEARIALIGADGCTPILRSGLIAPAGRRRSGPAVRLYRESDAYEFRSGRAGLYWGVSFVPAGEVARDGSAGRCR